MRVLVIGGAGYIGSHVVYELINSGNQVVVLDNLSTGNHHAVVKEANFYKGDVQNEDILQTIFSNHKIDVVINLAAKLLVGESVKKPLEYFQNNVGGLISLLSMMNKFKVKNLVFSSTAAVYGRPQKNVAIKEDNYKSPINPYGSSKLADEHLIVGAHQAYGINYVIFRYFNVAGANVEAQIGQSINKVPTHLIPSIIYALEQNQPMSVFGDDYLTKDGTCIRDYIHVIDIAKAHVLGAQFVLKGQSEIFNLGSNRGYSIKEVINEVEKTMKIKVPYKIVKRRDGDPPLLVANTDKVIEILNFIPHFSLSEIIKSEFAWRKKHLF